MGLALFPSLLSPAGVTHAPLSHILTRVCSAALPEHAATSGAPETASSQTERSGQDTSGEPASGPKLKVEPKALPRSAKKTLQAQGDMPAPSTSPALAIQQKSNSDDKRTSDDSNETKPKTELAVVQTDGEANPAAPKEDEKEPKGRSTTETGGHNEDDEASPASPREEKEPKDPSKPSDAAGTPSSLQSPAPTKEEEPKDPSKPSDAAGTRCSLKSPAARRDRRHRSPRSRDSRLPKEEKEPKDSSKPSDAACTRCSLKSPPACRDRRHRLPRIRNNKHRSVSIVTQMNSIVVKHALLHAAAF